jgi:hypothetical protein
MTENYGFGILELHYNTLKKLSEKSQEDLMNNYTSDITDNENILYDFEKNKMLDVNLKSLFLKYYKEQKGVNLFRKLASVAMRIYCARNGLKNFDEKVNELNDVYRRKNSDYGNSFDESLELFGLGAAIVRIFDKVNRYENLRSKEEGLVNDESIEDTLLDLINYCAMSIMWISGRDGSIFE